MAVIDNGLPALAGLPEEDRPDWELWVASRPEKVRKACEALPWWYYYDYPETGQVVTIEAYAEDGTVRVLVVGDRISIPAIVMFEVFGVPVDALVRRP